MKTSSYSYLTKALGAFSIACVLALPPATQAKDHDHDNDDHDNGKHHRSHHDDHGDRDHDRVVYSSRPRSSFTLSLGDGYRGHGYYYGPANSSYYYERPEVSYYATREAAPREYYTTEAPRGSTGAAVQAALARRGYYHGSVDGAIGPQSRNAIAHYQADHGLRATGEISPGLLQSLGL